ncbi:MAG: hypothetical protein LBV23_02815 [Deltaproteobacteria bacterium]|jgi:hypothetical protein|nr:hypothetical protein [Deltaproteobacteria bacterium]
MKLGLSSYSIIFLVLIVFVTSPLAATRPDLCCLVKVSSSEQPWALPTRLNQNQVQLESKSHNHHSSDSLSSSSSHSSRSTAVPSSSNSKDASVPCGPLVCLNIPPAFQAFLQSYLVSWPTLASFLSLSPQTEWSPLSGYGDMIFRPPRS